MTTLLLDPPRVWSGRLNTGSNPFTGIHRLLGELESLLPIVPPALYETRPESGDLSMAQYVSQALDQIEALVCSATARVVAYEAPRADIGNDPQSTLRRVERLRTAMLRLPALSADDVLRVGQGTSPASPDWCWSTLEDETGFALNRLVHAYATIERRIAARGFPVPAAGTSTDLPPLRARSSVPPAWSLLRVLDELESLLGDMGTDTYCARFAPQVSGSIGEHVRHCLDHVAALLSAHPAAVLTYDCRQRGTDVETDPTEALRQILQLKRDFGPWSARPLDERIRVRSMSSPSGDAVSGWSTLARELAFVLSHTIHHQAIIGLLMALHGLSVPERFGHSPSTPRRH